MDTYSLFLIFYTVKLSASVNAVITASDPVGCTMCVMFILLAHFLVWSLQVEAETLQYTLLNGWY